MDQELSGDRKFIADVHLGRLAKYLRLCGFDTQYEVSMDDREIIDLSLSEKRIILTRDKELLKNRHVIYGYRIVSSKPVEQLREVMKRFDLKTDLHPLLGVWSVTDCFRCVEGGDYRQTDAKN
jgi:uncharacterized protein with PIN domain